ncbi:hypothetical protein HBB16_00465 [Pseudonocardia sp. MCCB 268]|nr:hypothetical protein [Pseudonocardia cytotoxica]
MTTTRSPGRCCTARAAGDRRRRPGLCSPARWPPTPRPGGWIRRRPRRHRPDLQAQRAATARRRSPSATPVTAQWKLLRIVAAGARATAPVTVSTAAPLPASCATGSSRSTRRCNTRTPVPGGYARELGVRGGRLRLVGGGTDEVVTATGGSPALAVDGPVVAAGAGQLLTFLREQAVSSDRAPVRDTHPTMSRPSCPAAS